jgi:hypothetical protein
MPEWNLFRTNLSDDLATKVTLVYYTDSREALPCFRSTPDLRVIFIAVVPA